MPDATFKQLNYIKNLLEQQGKGFHEVLDKVSFNTEDISNWNDLTKWQASEVIDLLRGGDLDD